MLFRVYLSELSRSVFRILSAIHPQAAIQSRCFLYAAWQGTFYRPCCFSFKVFVAHLYFIYACVSSSGGYPLAVRECYALWCRPIGPDLSPCLHLITFFVFPPVFVVPRLSSLQFSDLFSACMRCQEGARGVLLAASSGHRMGGADRTHPPQRRGGRVGGAAHAASDRSAQHVSAQCYCQGTAGVSSTSVGLRGSRVHNCGAYRAKRVAPLGQFQSACHLSL